MSRQKSLVLHLLDAFPPRHFHGDATSNACADSARLRAALDDASWWSLPGEFVRQHAHALPMLSREAYIAFLPAWLREAVEDRAGEVARVVVEELNKPQVAAYFSRQQGYAVIQIAKWLAEEPTHRGAFDSIERVWN